MKALILCQRTIETIFIVKFHNNEIPNTLPIQLTFQNNQTENFLHANRFAYVTLCLFVTVTELDVPPESDDSDCVSITQFWKSVEVKHLARGINGETTSKYSSGY